MFRKGSTLLRPDIAELDSANLNHVMIKPEQIWIERKNKTATGTVLDINRKRCLEWPEQKRP